VNSALATNTTVAFVLSLLLYASSSNSQAFSAKTADTSASISFKVEALAAQATPDKNLNATLVVTNTSAVSARAFVRSNPDPTATDNRGHAWTANAQNNVSGIYVCHVTEPCPTEELGSSQIAATVVDPGQSITIQIVFTPNTGSSNDDKLGDLYSLAMIAYVQPVREEQTDAGTKFVGGAWRTYSFGAVNRPLAGLE
jgi:hypothetical protein